MRVTLAQLNPVVGDISGNLARLDKAIKEARERHSDILAMPELFLTGYPPRDLLERSWFMKQVEQGIACACELSSQCPEMGVILGAPTPADLSRGKGLFNSALFICGGEVKACQHKSLLPIYDVFDEARYFDEAPHLRLIDHQGERIGISICEDAWNDPEFWPRRQIYSADPIASLAEMGATLLVNISASPYVLGKERVRHRLIGGHAARHGLPFIYVNQVGGNDELIFDGRSMVFDSQGRCVCLMPSFAEGFLTVDTAELAGPDRFQPDEAIVTVYQALVLGLRDYVGKCGFRQVVLGLSGGVDSAVTAVLAAAALGPANVLGIGMPGPYSSAGSLEDAEQLARSLGIDYRVIPIGGMYQAYLDGLQGAFAGKAFDSAEENIQARIRGNILMAFSNKFGSMVISTGNKSELSMGYCTLYGDMSGGLSVIGDLPKALVYELAAYINREREIIPASTMDKAPSAELRPDQTDQDSLPPYPVLDGILHLYIEENRSVEDIVEAGYNDETVLRIVSAVEKNEYKRKQAAPVLKITGKAFGAGRRMPIAARLRLEPR